MEKVPDPIFVRFSMRSMFTYCRVNGRYEPSIKPVTADNVYIHNDAVAIWIQMHTYAHCAGSHFSLKVSFDDGGHDERFMDDLTIRT